ncbi:hypothetical protein MX201_002524 [Salmonella enterica]|nr:hypothetical protein [Salmonella enterica]EGY4513288.1 hypothetical protein [Salmonella enterica]EGY4703665.1 hypothetical protein [Salmonella enterica]EHG4022811.1 hypothetical protein [Salmonella enterica]EHK3106891.1 hypothetical protein [Salmonella enterica]
MLNSKMKSYEEIKIIVLNAVNQVLIDNELTIEKINENKNIISDLQFSSLMVAQLIMLIQEEVDLEPFSNGYIISDMHTIADYINVYSGGKQ